MGEVTRRNDVDDHRWRLDPLVAILPGPRATLVVSSPHAWGEISASSYQVQLLLTFREARSIRQTLAEFPFNKAESHDFLVSCGRLGLLRKADAEGAVEPPERVPAKPRFAGAPSPDPEAPAAFTFLGIPFDGNTTGVPGARFGPPALRASSEG
ncbi:MAG: arginase family protein, partial [Myxococcota bacterium]